MALPGPTRQWWILRADPRWGRIAEGAGEDPCLGSKIAVALIKGYQGDDLSLNNTMMACVKHFALYGAAEAGRDYNTVDMSRLTMFNDYLPPYKAAVDAGAGSVMTAFQCCRRNSCNRQSLASD